MRNETIQFQADVRKFHISLASTLDAVRSYLRKGPGSQQRLQDALLSLTYDTAALVGSTNDLLNSTPAGRAFAEAVGWASTLKSAQDFLLAANTFSAAVGRFGFESEQGRSTLRAFALKGGACG